MNMKTRSIASSRWLRHVLASASLLPFLVSAAPSLTTIWSQGGHAARVSAVACSRDGNVLASASEDFTVKLWSTNGTLLRTLNTAPSPATCLALSPDGANLAVGTYFGGFASGSVGRVGYSSIPGLGLVHLWQAPDGWTSSNVGLVRTYTNKSGKITSVAFSADKLRLAWGNAAGSNLVASTTGATVLATRPGYNTSVGPAGVTSVALSAYGWLLSGCEDKTLRLWNPSWSQVWTSSSSHASNVTSVAFSPDGAAFVSGSLDNTLRLWLTNGALGRTFAGHAAGVTAVAFSPDAATLASGSLDGSIKLWDSQAGTCLVTIPAHSGPVTSLDFMPDSSRLLSGGEDARVRLWSAANGTLLQTFGGQEYVGTVAISPDGTLCASAGGGCGISVRRSADGSSVVTLAGHTNYVSAIAFAPDSGVLASGGGPLDSTVKLWRLSDGAMIRTITAGSNGVTALAFSPDGKLLASGGDCTEKAIALWEPGTGALVRSLAGHSNGVTALTFSPDGNLLASGGRRFDHAVKIWAVTNGALLSSLTGHANNIETVAFAPGGHSLASGSSGFNSLKIWQLSDGSSRSFGTSTNLIYALAFSPDGATLASTDRDTVKFWNVSSGALSETVTHEIFRLSCLACSPNWNLFFVGREDAALVLSANTRGALVQAPLTFRGLSVGQDNSTTLETTVQPWTRYVFESSTDMANWVFRAWSFSPSNSLSIHGLGYGNAPAQFYRALTPP
jgi:WD40 repeat protein